MDMVSTLSRLGEVGDAFFREGSRWVSEEGRMSEQIDRSVALSDGVAISSTGCTGCLALIP